ncbi:MAG: 30S ribosomal protein S16 [Parcubacteria group bacterium GW2011_GWF2_44_8b]|nr:MAG: 30S ribosomal protein S16 [Parcubacteria group bacterium GW2011_GWC1_43_30]KKT78956.1 MAG: 30S ribosomal protein S16 [Parcubacteria group bacterium GW2011_GWF2_44_8b]
MLKIRLQRIGRTHEPSFRLVLTESKNSTKSGRFKEILGSYDPRKSNDSLNIERIKYWLSQGASPTPTIHNLLVKHRIINAKKINVSRPLTPEPARHLPEAKPMAGGRSDGGQAAKSEVEKTSDTIEPVVEKEAV